MEDLVVGLDLGTSKACCVIGVRDEQDNFHIVGVGQATSTGVRAGVINSIRAAAQAVQTAVEKAEASGYEVRRVIAGMAGGSIEGLNSRGVVAVSGQQEISCLDMERVIDAAKAVLIPMDREILHVIPQEFTVDDAKGVKNPQGMMGIRLEADVHIITASQAVSRNLVQCVNGAGFEIDEVVLDSLAGSQAVLSREEKDVGVLVIDHGAGTSDVILFFEGAPRFSKVYPLGADRITKDIAQVLQIPQKDAEELKIKYGCAFVPALMDDCEVIIRGVGSRPAFALKRSQIGQIIQARVQEILNTMAKDIARTGLLEQLGAGIVFIGGGAHLEGLTELASEIFGKPARMGVPMNINGLDEAWYRPEFATAVGLVLWKKDPVADMVFHDQEKKEEPSWKRKKSSFLGSKTANKIWDFIKKNFI